MAGDGERKMLFDLRGRRRNAIRFIYALLAVLMGASLMLVVGPFNLGELVGNQAGSSARVFDEQVERLEGRLAANPQDEGVLLSLTRARINAGNAKLEDGGSPENPKPPPPEARQDFREALRTWERYLKLAGDEANPSAAQLVAGTYFRLAETGSTTLNEIRQNVAVAAEAQRIAAEQRPNVGSLSTLAIYQYFDGEFAAGDRSARRAAERATSKEEAKNIEDQLREFRGNGRQFVRSSEQAEQAQRDGGNGFQNPFSLTPNGQ